MNKWQSIVTAATFTLDTALHFPIGSIPTAQLWKAVKVIRAHKLHLRETQPADKIAGELRACNQRIDALLAEEDERNRRQRPA